MLLQNLQAQGVILQQNVQNNPLHFPLDIYKFEM